MRRRGWSGADNAMRWPLFRSVRVAPLSGVVWALCLLLYANGAGKTDRDVIVWVATEPVTVGRCEVIVRARPGGFEVCESVITPHGPSSPCISDSDLSTLLNPEELESRGWCGVKNRLPIRVMADQCQTYDEAYQVLNALSWDGWVYHDVRIGPEETRSEPCENLDSEAG